MLSREGHPIPPPARSGQTGVGPFCTTAFAPGLASCPALAPGSNSRPRGAHHNGRLAGDGAGYGGLLHQLSSRLEPGDLVGSAGRPDSLGTSRRLPGALGRSDHPRVDDTVERRCGRKITARGCYRDAVRSTCSYACATQAGLSRLGSNMTCTSSVMRGGGSRRATTISLLPDKQGTTRPPLLERYPQKAVTIPGAQGRPRDA
jgi:hypothetical protein